MFKVRCLLSVLVILVLTQAASAWWWKRKDCPRQQHCPVTCYSGYVSHTDYRGCKQQLCKCQDVCEHFNCPAKTRCQRKFHCETFGRCSVYPTCVVVLDLTPTRANEKPITTESTTTTTKTTKAITTTTTSTTTPQPTTPSTTPKIVQPTRAGVQVTQKTAAPSLCQSGGQHLARSRCGPQDFGSRPCPASYQCESAGGSLYLCCPVPSTTTTATTTPEPTTTTTAIPTTTTPEPTTTTTAIPTTTKADVILQQPDTNGTQILCPDGQRHLAGWFCGRGGERCPNTHTCLIHPADRYAVCCPIPVPDNQPQNPTTTHPLPMCEEPLKVGPCKASLPRWHFNSGNGQCELFGYGGCEGNANNFSSKRFCERACGRPGQSYCSLPPQVGRCRAAFQRYFYDSTKGTCTQFVYGGCEGNGNNFKSLEQCQHFCD